MIRRWMRIARLAAACLAASALATAHAVEVGTTAGTFAVSPGGAATYQVPLSLAPGIGGMTPQLAISYSSQGTDTTMGMGFGISGLSQIARCASTKVQDDLTDPVDLDGYDRYCLDGQRLVTTQVYGAVGSEYRTEVESFSRVQSDGGGPNNPLSWTVTTRAGLKMTYGLLDGDTSGLVSRTLESGDVMTYIWLLRRTEDTAGNFIDYLWAQSDHQYRISEVHYGGSAANGGFATQKVLFAYADRDGYIPVGWLYRKQFMQAKFLQSVTAYSLNMDAVFERTRVWKLTYNHGAASSADTPPDSDPPPIDPEPCLIACPVAPPITWAVQSTSAEASTTKSLVLDRYALSTIQECAPDPSGDTCLPTTNFVWSSDVGSTVAESAVSFASLPSSRDEYIADVNGDGYADAISAEVTDDGTLKAFVIKSGTGARVASPERVFDDDTHIIIGDFNGDGKADLGVVNHDVSCGYPVYYMPGQSDYKFGAPIGKRTQEPTGGGCGGSSLALSSDEVEITDQIAGDLNADGLDDVLLVSNTGEGLRLRLVFRVPTDQLFMVTQWFEPENAGNDYSAFAVLPADFNGDGQLDFLLARTGDDGHFKVCLTVADQDVRVACKDAHDLVTDDQDRSPILGDVNGDGYTDVIIPQRQHGMLYADVLLSKGDGTFDTAEGTLPISDDGYAQFSLGGDFDGDGLADLLWIRKVSGATTFKLMSSVGNGQFALSDTLSNAYSGLDDNDEWEIYTGDFNGDGRVSAMVYTDDDTDSSVRIADFQGYPNLRVKRIINGLGVAIDIEYKSLLDGAVYGSDGSTASWPIRELRVPQYVVSKHTTSGQTVEARSVTYKYYGMKYHTAGRGSLGFSKMDVKDLTTNILDSTSYYQSFPYIGLTRQNVRKIAGGANIATSLNQMNNRDLPFGSKFAWVSGSVSKAYETESGYAGVTTATVALYSYEDDYGNLTASQVDVYQGDVVQGSPGQYRTLSSYAYQDDINRWCLGRVKTADVAKFGPNGDSRSRSTAYEYDAQTCLLSAETVEPQDQTNLFLRTEYDRDTAGNIITTRVMDYLAFSGQSSGTRTTTNEFDMAAPNYGRFATRTCNALLHCESRQIDFRTGAPTQVTSPNWLVTHYTYDAFGRAKGSSFSDTSIGVNTWTSTTREWCADSACGAPGVYKITATDSGGGLSRTVYDAYEREIARAAKGPDGAMRETFTGYDAAGRVNQVSSPRIAGTSTLFVTTTQYDAVGRPKTITSPKDQDHPTGRVERLSYQGLKTVATDARQHATTRITDAEGRVQQIIDARGKSLSYAYTAFGDLKQTRDPSGNEVNISIDRRGRKVSMSDPDMGSWSYVYDGFGDLRKQTDAKQQDTLMNYDMLGRMVSRVDSDSRSIWTYDVQWKGALAWADLYDQKATVGNTSDDERIFRRRYTYTSLGSVYQEIVEYGGTTYTSTYTYDGQNRVKTLKYPSGLTLSYTYSDTTGALKKIYNTAVTSTVYWEATAWDEWSKVYEYKLGNGIETMEFRDPAVGQLGAIMSGAGGSSSIQNLGYEWDENANITHRSDLNAGYSESFTYDELDRLKTTTLSTPDVNTSSTMAYDDLGNITTKPGVGSYAYTSGRPHAVSGVGSASYQYDANGNMKAASGGTTGTRSYTWASYNLPTVLVAPTGSAYFSYGPDREKIKQVANSSMTGDRTVIYINALTERHTLPSSDEYREYISSPSGLIAAAHTPVGRPTQRSIYYFHRDHLGSIDTITNSVGQIINQYQVAKHFALQIQDTAFSFTRKAEGIASEAALDGLYIIRTSVSE